MQADAAGAANRELFIGLARQLMLTSRRWRARFNDRMKAVGQTHARYKVLYWIDDSGNEIGQRDLAERMGIEEPTLARLLDALEAQGMIVRRPSPVDRRAKLVSMTERAKPVLRDGNIEVEALVDEAFEGLEAEDARCCVEVLDGLNKRLEELAGAAKRQAAAKTAKA